MMKRFILIALITQLFSFSVYADENGFASEFDDEFSDNGSVYDPLIGYNRFMTSVNDKVYLYVMDPTAKVYAAVIPEPLRIGISNATDNIKFPIRFANNLLQLKFENAGTELKRFLINSTIGIGGLMDPADKHFELKAQEEDFGQTLGHYGIKSGAHIVLPIIGPSNVRDSIGLFVDTLSSPLTYTKGDTLKEYQIPTKRSEAVWILVIEKTNETSLHLGEYQSLKKDALDWYIFLRNAYEDQRKDQISK